MKRFEMILILLFLIGGSIVAQEFHPVWNPGDLQEIESYSEDEKIVGTHYFYWYDYPDSHFFDDAERTDDALQDHFPVAEEVSFHSLEWHGKQLEDCVTAEIDFILPVYWGTLDHYFKKGTAFSVQGLGPLQEAIERREMEELKSPKIGLFYDTSTLLPGIRGLVGVSEKPDLTTKEGKDLFYRTIRDFFYQIEPRNWAAIEGRPLVVLYSSSFAKRHDQSTFDYVYEHFEKDFHGIRPYIIKDNSWGGETDAITQWGAALGGPNLFDKVAQIGPGYNDMAVPGRSTPIRDREDGNFYRWSWIQAINSSASIVLVETWNEMHEGTDICDSREYGKEYIELTKEYGNKFREHNQIEEEIELKHPAPRPRPPSDEGSEYKDSNQVQIQLGRSIVSEGIELVGGVEDGPVLKAKIGDEDCIRTIDADLTYMYFKVVDPFYYDDHENLVVEYTYWDDGFQWHQLQYDSHEEEATLSGAYTNEAQVFSQERERWVTRKVKLNEARFVNRQNSGADFRFAVAGGWFAVKDIQIRKLSSVQ